MVGKSITHTAEDLAHSGRETLVSLGRNLERTASHAEGAVTQAAARGSKALRREGEWVRSAAKDAAGDTARLTARTLRDHPYLSVAAALGGVIALAGITLLAARATSR